MKYLLAVALLVGFAAVNLLLNFYAPSSIKLLLVPVFSLVFIAAIAGVFRRKSGDSSPPS